ncbi:uncharacterized protein PG998_011406 [Apiospora kogelbergensis]|uniref:uncharacterized protein n=1 Tax=Apiospora kogelbergensis TaxID=1337665 RepID=UPI00312FC71C
MAPTFLPRNVSDAASGFNKSTIFGGDSRTMVTMAPATVPNATATVYQGDQFKFDARSMGFAIGFLLLFGVFFAWLILSDCCGKHRFKMPLRRRRAPRSAKSGAGSILPSFLRRSAQPAQQQPMQQSTQSAAGTATTITSAATATVVATSSSSGATAPNSGDEPFDAAAQMENGAANGSSGSGSEATGETATTTTSNTTFPSSSPRAHRKSSGGVPAATNDDGRPRAAAAVADAPTAPSFRRSTPPRLPTPNGMPSEDGEKRKSSHSLGKAVFGVFSRNGSASQV